MSAIFHRRKALSATACLHVIEDNLTAAELKHASLRQIAEESIHMDSLLHIIGSLNIDLDEVTAKFQDIPSIQRKNALHHAGICRELKMGRRPHADRPTSRSFAKALFGITQVMEGTQFLRALRHDSLPASPEQDEPALGQMFQYTLRDESNHIALGRYILQELIAEKSRYLGLTNSARKLVEFHARRRRAGEGVRPPICLPEDIVGMTQKDFLEYVDYNADRRLTQPSALPALSGVKNNPFLWLDEVMFLKKEKNFFETRVTEYQTSGSVKNTNEDDLI